MDAQSRRCTITTCHLHYAHVMCPYKGCFGLLWGIVVDLQEGRDKEHKPVSLCVCVCARVYLEGSVVGGHGCLPALF